MLYITVFVLLSFAWLPCNSVTLNSSTNCPSRDDLYPCYCTSVPLSKRHVFTVITCSFVQDGRSLESVFSSLRGMVIDRFILLDSFWNAKVEDSILPRNWMSLLRIKEFEIIDSRLSPSFACNTPNGCPNKFLTRLIIRNSTSGENITNLCKSGSSMFYWTSCLAKMQYVSFSHNKLKSFDKSTFPTVMPDLLTLNLSHNEITTVGPSSFANLPKLTALDLSNNRIKVLDNGMFGREPTVLTHLDLSWNAIINLSAEIFKLTPYLISFSARGNHLTVLPYEHWQHLANKTIKLVDLQDNLIQCDCHLIWINCTLEVHTNVLGFCASGYEDTPLRRVAKYMSERCDKDGVLQIRKNKTKGNACNGWWKEANLNMVERDVDNGLRPFAVQLTHLPTPRTRARSLRKS